LPDREALRLAREGKQARYLSVQPCPRGHTGFRYTASQGCCECQYINASVRLSKLTPEELASKLESQRAYVRGRAKIKQEKLNAVKAEDRKRIKQIQSQLGIDLPTSKAEAVACNSPHFFNGIPCPKGHVSQRFAASGGCHECSKELGREYRRKKWAENKEEIKKASREYFHKNKPARLAAHKAYVAKNYDAVREQQRQYFKNNPQVSRFHGGTRRARKKMATPPWLKGDLLKQVKSIYSEATEISKVTGEVMHVDHLIPICGNGVCGLHVPWNLRILTRKENCSKRSEFDPHTAREASIPLGCGAALGSYQLL